ncbi:MAG: hypothetical protein GY765_27945 [bacterium]|nr:hypothetical protein [bacterium]
MEGKKNYSMRYTFDAEFNRLNEFVDRDENIRSPYTISGGKLYRLVDADESRSLHIIDID